LSKLPVVIVSFIFFGVLYLTGCSLSPRQTVSVPSPAQFIEAEQPDLRVEARKSSLLRAVLWAGPAAFAAYWFQAVS